MQMDKEKLVTRTYRETDYTAVIELWQKTGIPCKPGGRDARDTMHRELANNPHTLFLLVEIGERLIGTVLATQDGRKGWINRLAVEPGWQRRGIARLLLEAAEDHLHGLGIEIIACLIEDYNDPSMRFFENAGYIRQDDAIYYTKRKHPGV